MPKNGSVDPTGLLRLLGQKSFVIYSIGNCASLIGTWAYRLIAGWLAWELTQSGAWLGLIVFADLFPTILLTPLAGVMADRTNKVRVLRWVPLLTMFQALTLAFLVSTESLTIIGLFALTMVLGGADAVGNPYRLTLIHTLVPPALLASAVAFNSIVFNTARFLGPALAGLLIMTMGPAFCFLMIAAAFAAFLIALAFLETGPDPSPTAGVGIVAQLRDGLRYIAADDVIPTLLVVIVATGLLVRPIMDLLPGISASNFLVGPAGLSALTSSVAAGALLGGICLGSQGHGRDMASITGLCAFMMGLTGLAATLTGNIYLALPIYAGLGFFSAALLIAVQTAIQLRCAPLMRGRVLGTYGLVFRVAPALGALGMGILTEFLGFVVPLAIASIALVIIAAGLWYRLLKMP